MMTSAPVKNFFFSCVAFLIVWVPLFVIGEGVIRWLVPASDGLKLGILLPDSERVYGLKPHSHSLQTGVQIDTNSLGFREREYAVEKRVGVKRMVVLGDSYTLGVGVPFEETFSKRIEAKLNISQQTWEVINFGVSGYNTVQELATFREVAKAFQPDVVLLAYVLNDADRLTSSTSPSSRNQGNDRTLLNRLHLYAKDTSLLYKYLSPKIGLLFGLFNMRYAVGSTNEIIHSYGDSSLGWIESQQALLSIATEARHINADMLVAIFPMMIDFATYPLSQAHEKIRKFSQAHGVKVLDLLPRLTQEDASALTVFLDGHPNSRAHQIFADEILAYLSQSGIVK